MPVPSLNTRRSEHAKPAPPRQRVVPSSRSSDDDDEEGDSEEEDKEDDFNEGCDEDDLDMGLVRYTEHGPKPLCLHCLENDVEELKEQVRQQTAELKRQSKGHNQRLEAKHAKAKEALMEQVTARLPRAFSRPSTSVAVTREKATSAHPPRAKSASTAAVVQPPQEAKSPRTWGGDAALARK
ncbi:uncharacterized protein IUM83_11755 [Phytophthora cinnamomi]|uniref:uncharacterized protein n=1 Tax=Phytophthora cinnamomi TaxID=4785 RepID=UPI002A292F99|nr:hypothetical protein IUM83_11755 [Phytophthora cinnamomi]KAJ8540578.1 hypothetical protein ON010_g12648 [Phytophthora cinnamomi]